MVDEQMLLTRYSIALDDQSHETLLGSEERRPTLPFNGYGEWVAKLYA